MPIRYNEHTRYRIGTRCYVLPRHGMYGQMTSYGRLVPFYD